MLSRRVLFYLLLNVFVSVMTVLVTLWFWNRGTARQLAEVAPTLEQPVEVVADNVVEVLPTLTPVLDATQEAAVAAPVHEVVAGDTLGGIASQYEVDVEDIVSANNMTSESEILNLGQKLIIPVAQPEPEEAAAAALPTSAVVELATLPPANLDANVQIQAVVDPGVSSAEAIEIVAPSDDASAIPMINWKIVGSNGREFVFPEITLYPTGEVRINTGPGVNTATDLYWNQTSAVWTAGDSLSLVDPEGNVRSTFIVP